jgi:ATP-binding cassette, subfamily B, bacterial PglK
MAPKKIEILKKAYSFLSKKEKINGLKVLFIVVGMAIFEVIGIASIMPFLAILGDQNIIYENDYLKLIYDFATQRGVSSVNGFLIFLGGVSFSLVLASAAYRTYAQYYLTHFIQMRRHSLSLKLFANYLNNSYDFFIERHSGELAKTVISEIDQLVNNFILPIINMFAYSVVLVFLVGLVLAVNPAVALLSGGIIGGIYFIFYIYIGKKLDFLGLEIVDSNKKRFVVVTEAFGGVKSLKIQGCENEFIERFAVQSARYSKTITTNEVLKQIPLYLVEAFAFGGLLLICIFLLINNEGDSGAALGKILPILGLYAFTAYRIKPSMQFVFQGYAALKFGAPAVNTIHSEMSLPERHEESSCQFADNMVIKNCISISSLNYKYMSASKFSVKDLNLNIPVGSSLGIVGGTGAGKSTFVDLLLGLLSPSSGTIAIDDTQLSRANIRAWQRTIGYVPQEIYLVDDTIAANIAFGVEAKNVDLERVKECAKLSQINSFIEKTMAAGYDTRVGEKGVKLSGGQRQRIGIARALYHRPQVLIFDEATSALDTVTEKALMAAIQSLFGKLTIIMIAHRISTVKNCDNIILLEDASIVANASYETLIAEPQFARYITGDI